ncbi:hypothetical protein CDD83_9337 [Cordyceps sp. RAO-2017]|nr:hypothetical protein CDD83_9337 [Cordyceps sp. RAO-2017]
MPPPSEQTSLVELACPASCVSAFCQAVMSKTIPNGFWGEGDTMCHNRATFLHKVDHFIKLRRFESMTLHEISQGQKVVDIAWLRPPGCHGQRLSQGDMNKRQEMFHEFLYYVFDSLLIPLIRSNFYVTESSTHRYEMFYFRHDVWKLATEPSLSALRSSMFEEVKLEEAQRLLNSRRLGYGHLRLLPKGNKFRPIVNLRRRNLSASSSKALNPSINSILGPIHTVLKFEKDTNPLRLGSSLLSVGDVYHRLKRFKESLGPEERRLYLAKIDVHAAFDTIPQAPVTELMAGIFSQRLYTIKKHVEVRPGERSMPEPSRAATRALKRWRSTAAGDGRVEPLLERLKRELGGHRKNTIFVESAAHKTCSVESLVSLLADHVERHLVRFGRKYFRQSRGIPQGSVLSSSLCNYFYADLEMRHLGFLSSPDCLLMRLVDDFLLISLDEAKAAAFVRTMHGGLPDYGVEVSREKTLVNFDLEVEGREVRKVPQGQGFPYCGMLIDSRSLDIAKDRRRGDGVAVANSLTVDFGRSPGHNFQRKILNAFKIQSHLMFYDTSHNSNDAVLQSLEGAFCETGRKMWAYIRCFPRPQRPSGSLIIQTITKVANIAFLILSGKSRRTKYPRYSFDIRKRQVSSIAHSSFLEILSQKQTGYSQVISWLRRQHRRETPGRLSA